MRIQSIPTQSNCTVNFRKFKILQPEKFSPSLLKAVNANIEFKNLSTALEAEIPRVSLRCLLLKMGYDTVKQATCSCLEIFTSDGANVLNPKINLLKSYKAEDEEALVALLESEPIDSHALLKKTIDFYTE